MNNTNLITALIFMKSNMFCIDNNIDTKYIRAIGHIYMAMYHLMNVFKLNSICMDDIHNHINEVIKNRPDILESITNITSAEWFQNEADKAKDSKELALSFLVRFELLDESCITCLKIKSHESLISPFQNN